MRVETTRPTMDMAECFDVLIVGAGFSGIYLLYLMRKTGLDARVVERGSGVGGTWYWNRYPGARCDVPSIAYSVSYLPDLDQEWRWKEAFAAQPEILAYIEHIEDRLSLRQFISTNTEVSSAKWDSQRKTWDVFTSDGVHRRARFVVMATGTLTVPQMPDVPGLSSFHGRWFHTGRWPHEEVDFKGRRVAVVGTGSTGIQVIPEVAKVASQVTVFQRTPKFTVPVANRPLSEEDIASIRARYPEFRRACRQADFGYAVEHPAFLLTEISPAERERILEELWNDGRFPALLVTYKEHLGLKNAAVNDLLADFARRKIAQIVRDPRTAETLTPRGYPIGVNRLCRDTNYYEAFNRPNVSLVDTRAEPIVAVEPDGIRTTAQLYTCDDIVFATGYDALTGAVTAVDFTGTAGRSLKSDWEDGGSAYLGIAVSGYPNLFLVTGPGGPSVLSNVVVTSEQNVEFIVSLLQYMCERGYTQVEVSQQAENEWMKHVEDVSQQSLYREAHKANAWYTGKNIPGKQVRFLPYSGGVGKYGEICNEIASAGYRGFLFQ
jgi:cyclohexanone monooxygenase